MRCDDALNACVLCVTAISTVPHPPHTNKHRTGQGCKKPICGQVPVYNLCFWSGVDLEVVQSALGFTRLRE